MQIIVRLIIPALIPIALGLLLSNIDKRNSDEIIKNLSKEHIIIRLPKAYLWVGCVEMSFTLMCLILMVLFQHDPLFELVWIALFLFGAIIVELSMVWQIHVFRHEDYFIYRTIFGRNHRVRYEECVSYKFGTNNLILEIYNKKIYIDSKATNFEFLLAMLTQYKVKEIK